MAHPVVLVVLDGWGLSDSPNNIINQTSLPTFDILNRHYPLIALQASGISVGLPWGEAGNSEVGHMTMGAGRIIYQNLPRISLAIQDDSFYKNKAFLESIQNVKKNNSKLHLIGLVGDGSVHSSLDHLYALLRLAKAQGLVDVYLHLFTDGRDSSPKAFGNHVLTQIEEEITTIGIGTIASISGRNWGMDRNNNWERISKAYDMLTRGIGTLSTDAHKSILDSYEADVTDEFIEPIVLSSDGETSLTTVTDADSIIFFNFREDRARQLTKAFVLPSFDKFPRPNRLSINFVSMTEYEKDLPTTVAFPPNEIHNSLGEVLSTHRFKQLRIAETEKYAHVTYFFNCGAEEPFANEDRMLIPSPAVDTFDQKPEMSAYEMTDKLLKALEEQDYDFILINYANADMVAHTGNKEAAGKALIVLDKCLKKLIKAVLKKDGQLLITADHGNVEVMEDPQTGGIDTKHNASPIPLWHITPNNHRKKTAGNIVRDQSEIRGLLSDIAPTILDIFNVRQPDDMHGESLLKTLR